MGDVYLGRSPSGQAAAVKVLQSDLAQDPDFRRRFSREVEIATQVSGLCTARVLGADVEADPPWLATEYVEGPTLKAYVEQHGPLGETRLRALAVALLEALREIHAAGVVHRDLTPNNILLAPDGPRVVDFGIAHHADASTLTRTGTFMGTPSWMAPEQAAGKRPTQATDIFSWGLVLTYAGTGRSPFGEGRPEAVLYRVVHDHPDLTGLPHSLRSVIETALAKEPEGRPGIDSLMRELFRQPVPPEEITTRIAEALSSAWVLEPTDPPKVTPTGHKPKTLIVAALTTLGFLIAAALAGWTLSNRSHPAELALAEREEAADERPDELVLVEEPSPAPVAPDTNDPNSYFTEDGADPLLTPTCSGVLSLCMENPVERALDRFGLEDERYAMQPGAMVRAWDLGLVQLHVTSDEVESISELFVRVEDPARVSTPVEDVVLGRTTLQEYWEEWQTMGGRLYSDALNGEGITVVTFWDWWGPEGSEVWSVHLTIGWGEDIANDILDADPQDAAGLLRLLGDRPLTGFSVGYDPPSSAYEDPDAAATEAMGEPPPWVAEQLASIGDGWELADGSAWIPGASLNAVTGFFMGSATGRGMHVFFFVEGRGYIGTDTSDPSNSVTISWRDDTTIAVEYTLYREGDPGCCPTGGSTIVRYRWNGERLSPLDPIPPLSGPVYR